MRLWKFFQFQGTAAESKQFGDVHAAVGNRIDTLEVIRAATNVE